jgi:ribose 5-phosphate isomerase A
MPFAWKAVKHSIEDLGGQGDLRPNANKDGLSISSYGSLVLDMSFDQSISEASLNQMLNNTPGIVEHGIFLGLTNAVFIADNGNVEEKWT